MTNNNDISDLLVLDIGGLSHCLKEKRMPLGRVRLLSSFLDTLLTDVFCRQLLPEAFKSVSQMTGYEFTFRPEIQLTNERGRINSCAIAVSVPAFANQPQHEHVIFSSPIYAGVLADFEGRERQQAYTKLVLLNRMLIGETTELDMRLNNSCLRPTAFVQFDDESFQRIVVVFKPKSQESMQDLLADLLADGCDLTALQPFLTTL